MLLVIGAPTWIALIPTLVLTGIGAGMISPVLPAAAMQGVPRDQTGVASTAANASRQLGISLGVATCALLLRLTVGDEETGGAPDSGWGAGVGAAGVCCAILCALAALAVHRLLRDRT